MTIRPLRLPFRGFEFLPDDPRHKANIRELESWARQMEPLGDSILPAVLSTKISTTSFANDTAENTFFTYTVPANSSVIGDVYRLTAWGRGLNNTGGNVGFTFRLKIGTTVLHQTPAITWNTSTLQRAWRVTWEMVIETTSAQRSFATLLVTATGVDGGGWAAFGTSETMLGFGSAAVALSSNRDLLLTIQMDTANANAQIDCRGAVLEKLVL